MNYDMMSVDEWLQAFFMAATCDGTTFVNEKEVTIDEIKSALRSAVIREASVKTLEVTGEDASTGWLKIEAGTLPNGIYDLIPKEVSK